MEQERRCWYAVYTRARWEKQVSRLLEQSGVVNYLPLYKSVRIWSDRKKTVVMPLFPSYIFVKTTRREHPEVLKTPGVVRIIKFEGKPVVVPEKQIDAIKLLLSENIDIEAPAINPKPGDKLEIKKGSLKGLAGELVEYRGKKKIAIRLDAIDKSIIINIPLSYAKIMGKNS